MMNIDIRKSKVIAFIPKAEDEGKGWSYSFVYSLLDIRNIYSLCYKYDGFSSITDCLSSCVSNNIVSESGKKWTKRNLLEVINALINFSLLEKGSMRPVDKSVKFENMGRIALTEKETCLLKDIYIRYKRFAEFWALFELSQEERIVLSFNYANRFTNSFILGTCSNSPIYRIIPNRTDTMRFWDVFCSWGEKLHMLEKVSSSFFHLETIPTTSGLSLLYKINTMPEDFSILDYIRSHKLKRIMFIPDLFFMLIKEFRYSMKEMKLKLTTEVLSHLDQYRFQSTSLINVSKYDKDYLPMVNNVYMSHLLKL
ncbi:hypothetical protein ETF27_05780 [Prevotella brunnea]|uniref:Uncharacterized protein n=1 Tax=Prevotella brunnea TaxID=2508867 RepID=A0A5C8GJI4_9BACT|nr:hypothetical protein [Prevotella brunnea]MDR0187074.1 hypothetical protein [Prevotella brunnea]TXJ62151.1 hypothetical protein ETF27_05780 [Prevotella brunnea]